MKLRTQTTMEQTDCSVAAFYAQQWGLHILGRVPYASAAGSLFWCTSSQYGECVLKIGKAAAEAWREYHALEEYGESLFCRVYKADRFGGAMLLERIRPGTALRKEPSLSQRLDCFCTLFQAFHRPPACPERFPTYTQWIRRITRVMENTEEHPWMTAHMRIARERYLALRRRYRRNLLLHGDLHHDNILLGEDGYRLIDPKGVIGDPVFEIGRFFINELHQRADDPIGEIQQLAVELTKRLSIPYRHILELVYIDLCLTARWFVEDGQIQEYRERLWSIDLLEVLLDRAG
jgi:streptomycin 6-kinase